MSSTEPSIFKRFLGRLPLVICLLLTIGVGGLWVRSYFVGDHFYWARMQDDSDTINWRRRGVVLSMGGVETYWDSQVSSSPWSLFEVRREYRNEGGLTGFGHGINTSPHYPMPHGSSDESLLSSLGFFYLNGERRDEGYDVKRIIVTIPVWLIIALTAAYPVGVYVAGVLRRQQEDRIALGLCPRCGSALTDELTRCPGCDKPVVMAQQA